MTNGEGEAADGPWSLARSGNQDPAVHWTNPAVLAEMMGEEERGSSFLGEGAYWEGAASG